MDFFFMISYKQGCFWKRICFCKSPATCKHGLNLHQGLAILCFMNYRVPLVYRWPLSRLEGKRSELTSQIPLKKFLNQASNIAPKIQSTAPENCTELNTFNLLLLLFYLWTNVWFLLLQYWSYQTDAAEIITSSMEGITLLSGKNGGNISVS